MALIEVVTVLALLSVGSLSQVITNPPQNAAVVEGDDTTFNCTAEDNGSPITVGWGFTPSGSSSQVGLSTGTTLTGIEMVTVSGVPRTTLTFSGVRREANGGVVQCIASGARSTPVNLTVQWRPTVNSEEIITLQEGTNDFFLRINFTEGNPRSTMNITGPFQPGNPRVSISSEGVRINGVSVNDSGTHIATWRNIEGVATFTLDLNVEVTAPPPTTTTPTPTPTPTPCDEVCIIIIIIVTIAVLIILVVVAVVVTVLLVRMCHKRRQKKSEGEQEDKNVPLS